MKYNELAQKARIQQGIDEWIDAMKDDPNWGKFTDNRAICRVTAASQFGYQFPQENELFTHYRIYRPSANQKIARAWLW